MANSSSPGRGTSPGTTTTTRGGRMRRSVPGCLTSWSGSGCRQPYSTQIPGTCSMNASTAAPGSSNSARRIEGGLETVTHPRCSPSWSWRATPGRVAVDRRRRARNLARPRSGTTNSTGSDREGVDSLSGSNSAQQLTRSVAAPAAPSTWTPTRASAASESRGGSLGSSSQSRLWASNHAAAGAGNLDRDQPAREGQPKRRQVREEESRHVGTVVRIPAVAHSQRAGGTEIIARSCRVRASCRRGCADEPGIRRRRATSARLAQARSRR